MNDEIMKQHCRRLLKQIAWRLQYVAKKRQARETPFVEEITGIDSMSNVISEIFVQQLLQKIPPIARYIIKSIVIEGRTEQELAKQLNISRQGVNKCKNKYLRALTQRTSLSV